MIRGYVPCTLPEAVSWHDAGAVPAGVSVHVVTPVLRQAHPDADEEQLEFLATAASDDQARAAAAAAAARRVTLAVDLADDGALPATGPATALRTTAPVPVADWAAVFVDDLEWYAVAELPHVR